MAAEGKEPWIGHESQAAKSGELLTACVYCVFGKLALDLYAVLDISLWTGGSGSPLAHCKVSV